MQDYRVETKVSNDGSLIIKGLPFQAGDKVEVIIRSHKDGERTGTCYPLRGKPIRYADPFGSVAEEDWEVLR
jgi:hypothetical protein